MSSELVVVSYYTRGTPYEQEAERLRVSLESFAPAWRIYSPDHPGSWDLATKLKPIVIFQAIQEFNGKRILYVDVDAELIAGLEALQAIPEQSFDIGFHRRQVRRKGELLSGTLLIEPNKCTLDLLWRWGQVNAQKPNVWDQLNLDEALGLVPGIRTHELGPEFCFIHDSMRRDHPDLSPVIVHYQASRRLRLRV